MKSFILAVLAVLLFFSLELNASMISVAPIQIFSEDLTSLSGRKIAEKISFGNLYLSYAGSGADDISNILEASSFCEKEGIECLIYGTLRRNKYHDSIELRFYNHESRTIEHVFFSSDNRDETGRLISDIKSKINDYLIEELSLYEPVDKKNTLPLITIPIAAGYWIPLDSFWGDMSVSLFSIRSGILLNPFEELIGTEHLSLKFHFGMNFLYEMALNDSNYEEFYQHKVKILLPLELSLSLMEKHRFSFMFSPMYQLEILSKTRNYQENEISFSSGFGFSTGIAYHYNFSDRFSSGISCNVDFTFFKNPQVNIRPELSFLIHCGSADKGKTDQ